MIIALWIATAVLALAFAMAGSMKVAKPYAQIAGQDRMEWTEEVTPAQLKTIGALEVVGAVGMILPAATGIAPWLTPVAAFALAVMMGVAFALHVRRRENGTPSLVLAAISLLVGIGWLVLS
ncbi:MAG: DoxX family protein [Leucobacter sp.]|nr:DoxX family protein [Leucobacter sp.]